MTQLPPSFPFRTELNPFLREYSRADTYLYVPKARVLSDANVDSIRGITRLIGDEFAGEQWNQSTQDAILSRAQELRLFSPTRPGREIQERTALVRIWKKLLELLGLVWMADDQELILTTAGTQLLADTDARTLLERQVARYQYPNPSLNTPYARGFRGLVPHIFLLEVLAKTGFSVTVDEHDLFVNLAQSHDDLERIVRYIRTWRDLTPEEQETVLSRIRRSPKSSRRFTRIKLNSSYQRSFLAYPSYLSASAEDGGIVARDQNLIERIVEASRAGRQVPIFDNAADWFAYYGDPEQRPSWFTFLTNQIERTQRRGQARRIAERGKQHVTASEAAELRRMEVEKGIEEFYSTRLGMIEQGLVLVDKGRQYSTPIGRIDLLCRSDDGRGEYVVIEIKAAEASDSVFGQILRYIGWVNRNLGDDVRGIILASAFPETARYSRIGLLKPDAEHFIGFKRHGLNVEDS